MLGTVLGQLNRRDGAETEWRDSPAIDPKSSIALDALSRDLIARNDYIRVIALLDKRSLTAAPLSAEQTVDLGALAAVNRLGDGVDFASWPFRLPGQLPNRASVTDGADDHGPTQRGVTGF